MRFRFHATVLVTFVLLFLAVPRQLRAQEWQPIAPEDLAMKSNPKEPGSHAMILYRKVEENDYRSFIKEYRRIKIFDEAGRTYGDVESEPFPGWEHVSTLTARTIHPDGSSVPFTGQWFVKAYAKTHLDEEAVLTFTLPDVTPGSIVEYQYTLSWDFSWDDTHFHYYDSFWTVAADLYEREAHFVFVPRLPPDQETVMKPYSQSFLLPADKKPTQQSYGAAAGKGQTLFQQTMDVQDIPAVEQEEFAPPIKERTARIEFYYIFDNLPSVDEFWRDTAKKMASTAESFMDRRGAMQARLSSIVSGSDSPEVKLHKIYDYVQSLRNRTFEARLTEKETGKLAANGNVEDVVKHGYGSHDELNETFVALARAAGFDGAVVAVAGRDARVFHHGLMKANQLSADIAVIRQNGKDSYFDPGMPACPFGAIPWEFTAVSGLRLRLDKKASTFITTPTPDPANAVISRKASLKLQEDGTLEGTVEVKFTGQEALNVRLAARRQDEAGRTKQLEDLARHWLLVKGEMKLDNVNDWNSSTAPLIATYKMSIPGYTNSGPSMYLKPMVFGAAYRNPFVPENRTSPIYFHYPYIYSDDITISLPAGVQADSVPSPKNFSNSMASYSTTYTKENGTVHLTRQFRLNGVFVDSKYYSSVRSYFGHIQESDDEQAMISKK